MPSVFSSAQVPQFARSSWLKSLCAIGFVMLCLSFSQHALAYKLYVRCGHCQLRYGMAEVSWNVLCFGQKSVAVPQNALPDQLKALLPTDVGSGFNKMREDFKTRESTPGQFRKGFLALTSKSWRKETEETESEEFISTSYILYDVPNAARASLENFQEGSSGLTQPHYGGEVIGDACWTNSSESGIHFVIGRVRASVNYGPRQQKTVKALAYAMWFRLLSHPEISAAKPVRVPVQLDVQRLTGKDTPLKMGKSLWLSLAGWRKLGVQVQKNARSGVFELTYKGKTVSLGQYSNTLNNGERTVKSETALFVETEEDGVPLEPVAAALGMRLTKLASSGK